MPSTNTITVTIRSAYGNEYIEPVCDRARLFAKLVKQKTLTMEDVAIIKKIGFTVQVQPNTPPTL